MRDAGYSESETLKELCSWNQLNRPPIVSIAEIRATVMSTFRHLPLRVTNMGAKSVLDLIRDQLRPLNLSPSEFTAVIVALSVTNTKENDWNGESIGVGELITSLESLANRSGVKKSQVRSMIKKIKDAGFVEISVLPGRLGSRWEWQGEFKKIFLGVETTENLDDD